MIKSFQWLLNFFVLLIAQPLTAETEIEKQLEMTSYGSFSHTNLAPNAIFYTDDKSKKETFEFRKAFKKPLI